jgi:hypothetical protein
VKGPTLAVAKTQMDLALLAGFNAVRVTEIWTPGDRRPSEGDLKGLHNAAAAAKLDGIQLIVTVTNAGSRTTPLMLEERSDFAAFAAAVAKQLPYARRFIVGNEPNLNRYWLPQFAADGSDAAAPAYEALLAQTYDAIKRVRPGAVVLGGAVSPHGGDDPNAIRPTHSPTVFIQDMAAAYRASGRKKPIMDGLVIHPYEDNSSVEPVKGVHPRSTTIAIADYAKLVALLGKAFDGTAQPGSQLPVYYGEFGIETQIPDAEADEYQGREPATVKPVDERTQGLYYREAVQLAFCQPNVRALMLFHTRDERELERWQSGLYYSDGTAKASLPIVRRAIREAHRGVVARCRGLRLTPKAVVVPGAAATLRVTCDIDCNYLARLGRLRLRGRLVGGRAGTIRFRGLRPGEYRVAVVLTAPVNPGPPRRLHARLLVSSVSI